MNKKPKYYCGSCLWFHHEDCEGYGICDNLRTDRNNVHCSNSRCSFWSSGETAKTEETANE